MKAILFLAVLSLQAQDIVLKAVSSPEIAVSASLCSGTCPGSVSVGSHDILISFGVGGCLLKETYTNAPNVATVTVTDNSAAGKIVIGGPLPTSTDSRVTNICPYMTKAGQHNNFFRVPVTVLNGQLQAIINTADSDLVEQLGDNVEGNADVLTANSGVNTTACVYTSRPGYVVFCVDEYGFQVYPTYGLFLDESLAVFGFGGGRTVFKSLCDHDRCMFNLPNKDGTAALVDDLPLLQLTTPGTKPTCVSGIRGKFWMTNGGTGVKDSVEICAKDAADEYAWRTIY